MEKTTISARVIADSITRRDKRITTMVITAPRMILAEFNTHRMFSRNSASSRAIPFDTMVKRVKEDPFIPIAWMKDHKGMQGTEYFSEEESINKGLKNLWLEDKESAIIWATKLSEAGLTKQIVNRILEPFMWHTIIVTATEWDNFFKLRLHEAAEIHMQELAKVMLDALNGSTPKVLEVGEWHIPFGDNIELDRVANYFDSIGQSVRTNVDYEEVMVKIATARCARVSYLNYEGKDDYGADINLFDQLSKSGHWSPFEHCATPTPIGEYSLGNFVGWKQLRHTIQSEEFQPDGRLVKHSIGEAN